MYVSEEIELSQGLLSRSGWSVIDDSETLLFGEDGFLTARPSSQLSDFYFLGYGLDFKACIRDYYSIAGKVPLIPKWVLGLWWSRWENYSQADILKNIQEFRDHGVPLSNHVIDMDWHVVENPYHNGWTGYTWNKESFSDPKGLFKELKENGVHVCLNLHPSGGVYPHEESYSEIAKFMGVDPESNQPILFDISDPKFIEGYFKFLHHPHEKLGVDFWWIDWQQESTSKLKGLDPLWFLNHLHSLDLKRDGDKRPLTFSRWGDHGSHRYPIGFSGDTYATWETLRYLPYFTATAANIGYGWWSHDVTGFQRYKYNDQELYLRWVQFAVFSPVFRFHNCGDPLINYKPWSKNAEIQDATIKALKLRRALVPYMYTAAWKNHSGHSPLSRPMYHDYPNSEEAYNFQDQFMFGDQMLVAPYLEQKNPETGLSRTTFWLPEGGWYHLQTGKFYENSGFYSAYGKLNDINVFVKAGAVIPLEIKDETAIVVFPGIGSGELYTDDGESMDFESGEFTHYTFAQNFENSLLTVKTHSNDAKNSDIAGFKYIIVNEDWDLNSTLDGNCDFLDSLEKHATKIKNFELKLSKQEFMDLLANFDLTGHNARPLEVNFDKISNDILYLKTQTADFTTAQLKCLLEIMTGCGFSSNRLKNGNDFLFAWKHSNFEGFSVDISERLQYSYRHVELLTSSPFLETNNTSNFTGWKAHVNYNNLLSYYAERP